MADKAGTPQTFHASMEGYTKNVWHPRAAARHVQFEQGPPRSTRAEAVRDAKAMKKPVVEDGKLRITWWGRCILSNRSMRKSSQIRENLHRVILEEHTPQDSEPR